MSASLRIGMLGLGEAGGAIAADLVAAGVAVRAWDPRPVRASPGVELVAAATDVVDADVVLSVNAASIAETAAASVAPVLAAPTIYADLNTSSAATKRAVAAIVAPTGARFADVALMGTVPGNGLRTPALVSGPGADRFAELLGALGMPVEAIGPQPGDAAARKLLRSVFMKGIAVCAVEALRAAEAAGCRDWLWDDIASTLTRADEALLTRLVSGTERHAARRAHEMADVCELLHELGVASTVSEAAVRSLHELAGDDAGPVPQPSR